MLLDQLRQTLSQSLKAGDSVRVETLRFLLSDVTNSAIAKYGSAGESSLTDEDILAVIRKQVKTHHESIDAFSKGKREDLVDKESAQLSILEEYLPKQLSEAELNEILQPLATSGETNFGALMSQAMTKVDGRAEGGKVAAALKKLLAQ